MKNFFRNLTLAAAFMMLLAICAAAQGNPNQKPTPPAPPPVAAEPAVVACPTIEIKKPERPVRDGDPLNLSITTNGGDAKVAPIFSWSISAGTIVGGQNTKSINVDTTGAGADKSIYATVSIGGFPPECTAQANATVTIAGPAKKVDEYSVLKDEEETARLDTFVPNITPTEVALVMVYAGRTSARGQARTDLNKIRTYLIKAGIPSERLSTVDGGFREQPTHELWIVPIGAEMPKASPTINAKDIVYPKPPPPVKKP